MGASLVVGNEEVALRDAWSIREELEHSVDLVIDGGHCGIEMTTVLDLTDGEPQLVRQGAGDASSLL